MIRPFRESDRQALKDLTASVFADAAIDRFLESKFGLIAGRDWKWRKVRHIDDDIAANPAGVFVAEQEGQIVGYVTVTLDREASIGRIPNLAVARDAQGRGIGRRLLDRALDYMRSEGMEVAKIETLVGNATGEHLYPSLGFEEVARQIHFFRRL